MNPTENGTDNWDMERAERNRQRALLIRQSKLVSHPQATQNDGNGGSSGGRAIKVQGERVIDSGGGFLITEADAEAPVKVVLDPGPMFFSDRPECLECNRHIDSSYLLEKFDHPVCDNCRDNADKHILITRSEAKEEYMLKDCDLDKRTPPLKYILKPNPHNPRYGEMKLYLLLQIEQRALEVHDGEENLKKQIELRDTKRQQVKVKKFNKKLKELRKEVRSSVYDRTKAASHTHTFGPSKYNAKDDNYTHSCVECGFVEDYEEM